MEGKAVRVSFLRFSVKPVVDLIVPIVMRLAGKKKEDEGVLENTSNLRLQDVLNSISDYVSLATEAISLMLNSI
jgi:hypothetical protein